MDKYTKTISEALSAAYTAERPEGCLKIKDFPEEEKPVERLLKHGPEALSEAELLAIILKTGRQGENVVDMARRVLSLSSDGSLCGLYDVTVEELKRLNGVGDCKAAQIVAVCQLAARISRDKSSRKKQNIKSITQLGEYLVSEMRWVKTEIFRIVTVDCRWNVINTVKISEGSINCSVVHPREVFAAAIKNYAAAVVLTHNHPSGNPTPSGEDFETTYTLIKAGKLLGIEVVDHIVTGSNEFYSMHLNGDMNRLSSEINREV